MVVSVTYVRVAGGSDHCGRAFRARGLSPPPGGPSRSTGRARFVGTNLGRECTRCVVLRQRSKSGGEPTDRIEHDEAAAIGAISGELTDELLVRSGRLRWVKRTEMTWSIWVVVAEIPVIPHDVPVPEPMPGRLQRDVRCPLHILTDGMVVCGSACGPLSGQSTGRGCREPELTSDASASRSSRPRARGHH